MATATEIEDFLAGPLVSWVCSCLDSIDRHVEYDDLVDGMLLHQVLLQIDPEPMHRGIVPSLGNAAVRVKNLDIIVKNIKSLFEEELCQVVLVMPDCVTLGMTPESKAGIENLQLLLLLLLGCAVQCPNKKRFIDDIKLMNVEEQHAIVDCIKQVTDGHQMVLPREPPEPFPADVLVSHLRRVARERDDYLGQWAAAVSRDRPEDARRSSQQPLPTAGAANPHHLAVELADWKSRLRKQRQELEEKSELLAECREELATQRCLATRLRQELSEQTQEARAAKAYRDELDAVRERAERVDKLEAEVQRYREKLTDIEFYKTRVDELREDNKVLLDTREMLEEQLLRARRRGDHVLELESELLKYKQHVNELTLDREADHEKLQELFEENAQLQLVAKSALNDNSSSLIDADSDCADKTADNSLSEQLTSNAQARALKLELDNRRLLSVIDSLKEDSFHDSSNKILELEKDKKKMSIKLEQQQDTAQRMSQQNVELEQMFKDAMEENGKLHDAMDALKANGDRLESDVQTARARLEELESSVEVGTKEKQRLQLLLEGLQRRLEEQERAAIAADAWRTDSLQVPELKAQLTAARGTIEALERDGVNVQREVVRLREAVEEKDMALDRCMTESTAQAEGTNQLMKELDQLGMQILKLQEVERESQDLISRAAVDKETLVTLQSNLVAHKLDNEQYKRILEKLGLNLEELVDPDTALDRIASSPEVLRLVRELMSREDPPGADAVPSPSEQLGPRQAERADGDASAGQTEEMAALLTSADSLRSENANLQVNVAMLQSQISSLSSQHLALQLANSQLAVEKEELCKERDVQATSHKQLLSDQEQLQRLHEQLAAEYESLLSEREALKAALRDARAELRAQHECAAKLHAAQDALDRECEARKADSRSLGNLRAEHSSLKDDFRNLFTASEKLKTEYRSLQEQYRSVRVELGALKLRHTEVHGELAARGDRATTLEVELSKVSNRCEMLSQMNSGLEDDRRSLMDHVSLLLTQYHELLTHSLEDKEHYHTEEKLFTDKVNHLCRQKEKLEEKIMEHYRKLDSCSTKKKSFGATLVKRVRKAGSDLINKVPRSRRSSWLEDTALSDAAPTSSVRGGSESGGAESDASAEELRPRDSFARSSLSLASAGTRRAVYFTEEDNDATDANAPAPDDNKAAPSTSTPIQENKPFLVYNRISTVIGGNESSHGPRESAPSPSLSTHSLSKPALGEDGKPKPKGKAENSIWYEYGCV